MKDAKESKSWWTKCSKADWKEALAKGKCVAGCDLEAHGKPCMHLYYELLKNGNIMPYVSVDRLDTERFDGLSAPSEPKEIEFRRKLKPFITLDNSVEGFITEYQADILVLKFVYELSLRDIAKDLGSSVNTVQAHYSKALETLKPVIKGFMYEEE